MRALDISDHPAVGTIDHDEIQRDRAAIIVKGDSDIGLVELLAQDRYRDGAKLPCRALDKEIVGLVLQRNPCGPQTRIKELARRGSVMRQSVGVIGRTVAVVGINVSDQRFRRAESGCCGRSFEHGNHKNQNRSNYLCHRSSLYLLAALSYSLPINEHCRIGGRKRGCANCSMKWPENLRSTRRRRYGVRRASRAASAFTPMPAWSKPRMALSSRSTTSRSGRLPAVSSLRRTGRSRMASLQNGRGSRRPSIR